MVWDAQNLPDEERYSSPEVELVTKLLQKIPFDCGKTGAKEEQPHVLTFYTKQSKCFSRFIDPSRVKVIDSAQGSEFQRGIISAGRHDGKPGFLNDRRRVNVGISRFRDQLIFVCNQRMLSASFFWRAMAEVWRSLGIIIDVGLGRLFESNFFNDPSLFCYKHFFSYDRNHIPMQGESFIFLKNIC